MTRATAIPTLLLLLAACSHASAGDRVLVRIRTGTDTVTVVAGVADTDPERRAGLSGRTRLAPAEGMAFLFHRPVRVGFWMKDTRIPLSIAFWGPAGRIVSIMDMIPCHVDPCPSFRPAAAFVGALEVNRGFFRERGIDVGDRVEFGSA
jgi:uncharacterized membrane protein (UPF0127 family)